MHGTYHNRRLLLAVLLALVACSRTATIPDRAALPAPPPPSPAARGAVFLPPNDEAPHISTVATPEWRFIFVGDIMLAGSATPELRQQGYDAPFTTFAPALRSADLAMANFEAPLETTAPAWPDKRFTFQMPSEVTTTLLRAGFDVVHLANNHIGDHGYWAMLETARRLRDAGLVPCGVGADAQRAASPVVRVLESGLRVAFVCFSNTLPESFWATSSRPGAAFGHPEAVSQAVAAARQSGDLVVVSFHWGAELMPEPKPYQIQLAHLAIDQGADIVIGHHPHVLQPVEWYRDRPIFYSLGNFVFGSYSHKVSESALVAVSGNGRTVTDVAVLPIDVFNPRVVFHPRPLAGQDGARVARALLRAPVRRDAAGWFHPAPTTTDIKESPDDRYRND